MRSKLAESNIQYLRISNFSMSSVPDSALRKDRLYTLRRLQNYFVDYEFGKLVVRKGYTKWNEKALPAPGTQIYIFQASDTERVLVISDNKWYVVHQTTPDPQLIIDETATSPRPILTIEQRCLLCTDTNAYWTDIDQLTGPNAFNLGIEKPSSPPIVTSLGFGGTSSGTPDEGYGIGLSSLAHRQIGIPFHLDANADIKTINVKMKYVLGEGGSAEVGGSIKISIYTSVDDKPTTLIDSKAISVYMSYASLTNTYAWHEFTFNDKVSPIGGTDYFIVVEGDDEYYLNHVSLLDAHVEVACVVHTTDYAFGPVIYNNSILHPHWHDFVVNPYEVPPEKIEAIFYIGGLELDRIFDYVVTYYNTDYRIESRPSDNMRIRSAWNKQWMQISSLPASADDPQVDKRRIYRRILNVDLDENASDDEITDTYKWVTDLDFGVNFIDLTPSDLLGAELQTQDHYTIRDTDDTGSGFRESALIPNVWCTWKGRVWFAEKDSNILYMTKKLEEDGATGMTGDPIPDFVPLTNKLETGYPYSIIGLLSLQADQMAIYFKNGSVWLLWGCDKPTNPPDDYSLKEMASIQGAIATKAICNVRGSHAFVSRDGIYVFNGNPDPESLSRSIDSLLKEITTANLEKSVLMLYGNELWALLDLNNDGVRDTVYILDLSREVATWRYYEYHDNITDFVVKNSSTSQRTILAVTDTNYIYELEKGQMDNYYPINVMVELHNLRLPNQIMITEISVKANYPGNPQPYVLTLTDHAEEKTEYFLNPSSSYDVRGHLTRCRGVSPISLRVKLEQKNILDANELWAINVGYIEK